MRAYVKTMPLMAAFLLVASVNSSSAQASDPLVGTWVLNLSKSKFENITPPKAERRYLELTEDGMILNVTETTSAKGTTSVSHYRTKFDGKEYPEFSRSSGSKVVAMLWFKRPNPNNLEVHVNSGGKPDSLTGPWTVSADGKTLTIDLKGTDEQGKPTRRIRVYDKQ
jgi:hypothetical protein